MLLLPPHLLHLPLSLLMLLLCRSCCCFTYAAAALHTLLLLHLASQLLPWPNCHYYCCCAFFTASPFPTPLLLLWLCSSNAAAPTPRSQLHCSVSPHLFALQKRSCNCTYHGACYVPSTSNPRLLPLPPCLLVDFVNAEPELCNVPVALIQQLQSISCCFHLTC